MTVLEQKILHFALVYTVIFTKISLKTLQFPENYTIFYLFRYFVLDLVDIVDIVGIYGVLIAMSGWGLGGDATGRSWATYLSWAL